VCRSFHVELIERHDAIDAPAPRQIADGVGDLFERQSFRHGDNFVQHIARPVGVAMLFERHQEHAAAQARALAHEGLALHVSRVAEDELSCRWLARHGFFFWLRHDFGFPPSMGNG
jgi:hypothetical protein